jgi:hypothetical protein
VRPWTWNLIRVSSKARQHTSAIASATMQSTTPGAAKRGWAGSLGASALCGAWQRRLSRGHSVRPAGPIACCPHHSYTPPAPSCQSPPGCHQAEPCGSLTRLCGDVRRRGRGASLHPERACAGGPRQVPHRVRGLGAGAGRSAWARGGLAAARFSWSVGGALLAGAKASPTVLSRPAPRRPGLPCDGGRGWPQLVPNPTLWPTCAAPR